MKLVLPAPATTADMLKAFLFYDKDRGLPSIVNRLDFQGVTRHQVFTSTLGELPKKFGNVLEPDSFNPRGATIRTLSSEEFQLQIREIAVAAFPEKRRLIFIHIPKCAGSDLTATLRRQFPVLDNPMSLPSITPKPEFFEMLRVFMTTLQFTDAIALSGHSPLKWYIERDLIRPGDDVFTIIRHPRDRIYSHLRYILGTIVKFRGAQRHDTSAWLAAIGLKEIDSDPSPAYLQDLGRQMLRARNVTPANVLCEYLGAGTAASAIEQVVQTNIELTDTIRYSAWRAAKFGYGPTNRVNESRPIFTANQASDSDQQFVEGLIGEDLALYERLQKTLSSTGGLSIRGRDLT